MTRSFLLAALILIANIAFAQTSPTANSAKTSKVGPAAVWQMPSSFIDNARKTCDRAGQPSSFAKCFIAQMSSAGAPPAAISFTQQLYDESHSEVGILSGFNAVGPVDVAWVIYPLRANTNNGLLFVNGSPAILNVEDLKLLDQKGMEQSFQYQDLKNQFPKVGVWPGDRDGKTWPNSQTGPNGGVQFVVGYPLINGCHACARAGFALFNWNFDSQGKFQGTTFLGLTPAPLSGGSSAPSTQQQ